MVRMKVSYLIEVSVSLHDLMFSDKAVFTSTEKAYNEDQVLLIHANYSN
jgi:hypothetical protein